MVSIPFPLSSTPGRYPAEGQGRLINVYSEAEGDRTLWRAAPGLKPFCDTARQGPRGFLYSNNLVYAAMKDRVVTINAAGTATPIPGTLDGDKRVTWARNNKSPTPDVVVVTENGAFVVTPAAITPYPSPNLPFPNSVSFLDGYLLFTVGDGRIFASGLNTTAVDALSFAKAESKSDGLVRGFVYGGQFYACGPGVIEVWSDVATSPFPLTRATVINIGLLGPWAVAGIDGQWDIAPIFVASDGTVRQLNGYQPVRISTHDIERDILAVADKATLEAFVCGAGGHALWVLNSPDWTWVYDATSSRWHERKSYGADRWRASASIRAFEKWLVGDVQSTTVQSVQDLLRWEDDEPLVARFESDAVKSFPNRIRVASAHFDFVVGQGSTLGVAPIQTDPVVEISWSHDGGATWATPLMRRLGAQGQTQQRVRIDRLGLTTGAGVRFRIDISDPVPVSLLGGEVFAQALRP